MDVTVALTDSQFQELLQAVQYNTDSVIFSVMFAGCAILAALMVAYFWRR